MVILASIRSLGNLPLVQKATVLVALPVAGALIYLLLRNQDDDEEFERPRAATSRQTVIEVKVPASAVGAVIGRAGSQIKKIQDETGARLNFRDDHVEADSTRVLVVRGTAETAQRAQDMVHKVIADMPKVIEKIIHVPSKAIGRIIGRSGETIRHISRTAKCRVNVSRDEVADKDGTKVVTLQGTETAVEAAVTLIEAKVEEDTKARQRALESLAARPQRGAPKQEPQNNMAADGDLEDEVKVTPPKASQEELGDAQSEWNTIKTGELERWPSPHGDFLQLVVTAVDSPGHFWVQLVTSRAPLLDTLSKNMTEYYNSDNNLALKPSNLVVGDVIAAPFAHDDTWYRARVVALLPNDEVDLYYVDYGDSGVVSRCDVMQLRSDFLSLPFQALECYLANVTPTDGQWSEAATQLFEQLCHVSRWRVLMARTVTYRAASDGTSLPCVQLVDTNQAEDLDIGDELVRLGHAVYEETESLDTTPAVNSQTEPSSQVAPPSSLSTSQERLFSELARWVSDDDVTVPPTLLPPVVQRGPGELSICCRSAAALEHALSTENLSAAPPGGELRNHAPLRRTASCEHLLHTVQEDDLTGSVTDTVDDVDLGRSLIPLLPGDSDVTAHLLMEPADRLVLRLQASLTDDAASDVSSAPSCDRRADLEVSAILVPVKPKPSMPLSPVMETNVTLSNFEDDKVTLDSSNLDDAFQDKVTLDSMTLDDLLDAKVTLKSVPSEEETISSLWKALSTEYLPVTSPSAASQASSVSASDVTLQEGEEAVRASRSPVLIAVKLPGQSADTDTQASVGKDHNVAAIQDGTSAGLPNHNVVTMCPVANEYPDTTGHEPGPPDVTMTSDNTDDCADPVRSEVNGHLETDLDIERVSNRIHDSPSYERHITESVHVTQLLDDSQDRLQLAPASIIQPPPAHLTGQSEAPLHVVPVTSSDTHLGRPDTAGLPCRVNALHDVDVTEPCYDVIVPRSDSVSLTEQSSRDHDRCSVRLERQESTVKPTCLADSRPEQVDTHHVTVIDREDLAQVAPHVVQQVADVDQQYSEVRPNDLGLDGVLDDYTSELTVNGIRHVTELQPQQVAGHVTAGVSRNLSEVRLADVPDDVISDVITEITRNGIGRCELTPCDVMDVTSHGEQEDRVLTSVRPERLSDDSSVASEEVDDVIRLLELEEPAASVTSRHTDLDHERARAALHQPPCSVTASPVDDVMRVTSSDRGIAVEELVSETPPAVRSQQLAAVVDPVSALRVNQDVSLTFEPNDIDVIDEGHARASVEESLAFDEIFCGVDHDRPLASACPITEDGLHTDQSDALLHDVTPVVRHPEIADGQERHLVQVSTESVLSRADSVTHIGDVTELLDDVTETLSDVTESRDSADRVASVSLRGQEHQHQQPVMNPQQQQHQPLCSSVIQYTDLDSTSDNDVTVRLGTADVITTNSSCATHGTHEQVSYAQEECAKDRVVDEISDVIDSSCEVNIAPAHSLTAVSSQESNNANIMTSLSASEVVTAACDVMPCSVTCGSVDDPVLRQCASESRQYLLHRPVLENTPAAQSLPHDKSVKRKSVSPSLKASPTNETSTVESNEEGSAEKHTDMTQGHSEVKTSESSAENGLQATVQGQSQGQGQIKRSEPGDGLQFYPQWMRQGGMRRFTTQHSVDQPPRPLAAKPQPKRYHSEADMHQRLRHSGHVHTAASMCSQTGLVEKLESLQEFTHLLAEVSLENETLSTAQCTKVDILMASDEEDGEWKENCAEELVAPDGISGTGYVDESDHSALPVSDVTSSDDISSTHRPQDDVIPMAYGPQDGLLAMNMNLDRNDNLEELADFQQAYELQHDDVTDHGDVTIEPVGDLAPMAEEEDLSPYHSDVTPFHSDVTPYHSDVTPYHSDVTPYHSDVTQPQFLDLPDDVLDEAERILTSLQPQTGPQATSQTQQGEGDDFLAEAEQCIREIFGSADHVSPGSFLPHARDYPATDTDSLDTDGAEIFNDSLEDAGAPVAEWQHTHWSPPVCDVTVYDVTQTPDADAAADCAWEFPISRYDVIDGLSQLLVSDRPRAHSWGGRDDVTDRCRGHYTARSATYSSCSSDRHPDSDLTDDLDLGTPREVDSDASPLMLVTREEPLIIPMTLTLTRRSRSPSPPGRMSRRDRHNSERAARGHVTSSPDSLERAAPMFAASRDIHGNRGDPDVLPPEIAMFARFRSSQDKTDDELLSEDSIDDVRGRDVTETGAAQQLQPTDEERRQVDDDIALD